MKNFKQTISAITIAFGFLCIITACGDDDEKPVVTEPTVSKYMVGVEVALNNEVLVPTEDLSSGIISPNNNGYEQSGWMFYFSAGDKIMIAEYNANNIITAYNLKDGGLNNVGSVSTDFQTFASAQIDDHTIAFVGTNYSAGTHKLYIIDVNTMTMTKSSTIPMELDAANDVASMPNGMVFRNNQIYISFHNVLLSNPRAINVSEGNKAKVAIYNYPDLSFDKIATDNRTPNVGRYASTTSLQMDERGDIYTYSTSSIASGMVPLPSKNSGILRIKDGSQDFDNSYYIDFESISGGYKINDLYYVKDGKAVVRVIKEDESNPNLSWAAYMSTSETPMVETGIMDLYSKTFTLLPNVPKSGGGFISPVLVEDNIAYVGISSSTYADIYKIDVTNNKATKGASIEGNYAKAILKVSE